MADRGVKKVQAARTRLLIQFEKSALVPCSLVVSLLLGLLMIAVPALAHSITVDGSDADWTAMAAPTTDDTGHIGRNASSQGQYIWKDKAEDELTGQVGPDTNYDLTEFRVTADSTNLYFLAVFSDTTSMTLPYLAIAVDLDQDGTGNTAFEDGADTSVSADARWEREIVVNSNKTGYFTEVLSFTSAGSSSISTADDVIEVSMPLSGLGISPPARVRFTVLIGEHDGSGGIKDIASSSDALDVVTNAADTSTELGDGVIDYYYDVWLNSSGEAYAPLSITEVLYDPSGADPGREWVQITNVSGVTIDLSNYKVGDEETKGGGEGMKRFPSGSITSGSIVIARDGGVFNTLYGFSPQYEFLSNSSVTDMVSYGTWASGSVSLSNDADEILLLDGSDTVIDAITWENGSYPGVTAHSGASNGESLERKSGNPDTNDTSADFTTVSNNGSPAQATYIELASFTATGHDGYVLVEWETASEIDNAGFNLWRSQAEVGPYTKLNADLIPARGGPTIGARYSFRDDAVTNGLTYWYKLEDVDLFGTRTMHGPVWATVLHHHRLYLPLVLKGRDAP